ncbi:MAG: hypothetical protein H7Z37_17300, partial [Pyrinomonadaceae bacterium]|nr:hypothetical protein [Pyrinomonadaceae bacterium]
MAIEKVDYQNFPNCLQISNEEVEIVVTTNIGARILRYGFTGGENILGEHFDARVQTNLGEWKPYGGHRLWIAPENMPNSYAPDDKPVEYEQINEFSARLAQSIEAATNAQKEMTITLDATGNGVTISHKLTNHDDAEMSAAAWAITIMRGGGEALIPREPFAPYSHDTLLPVR